MFNQAMPFDNSDGPGVGPLKSDRIPQSSENLSEEQPNVSSQIYTPLNAQRSEIRLLWLIPPTQPTPALDEAKGTYSDYNQPNDMYDPVHAELVTVSMPDKPSYVALSYVWGNGAEKRRIFLNGQLHWVNQNLYDFLVQFRHCGLGIKESAERAQPLAHTVSCPGVGSGCNSSDSRRSIPNNSEAYLAQKMRGIPLWIDALCINQSDVHERNSQILLMGDVYSNAAVVLSWLGSSEGGWRLRRLRHLAVRLMLAMSKEAEIGEANTSVGAIADCPCVEGTTGFATELSSWFMKPYMVRLLQKLWRDSRYHRDITFIFEDSYWRRVWIVQELVLSSPATHIFMQAGTFISQAELDLIKELTLAVFWDVERLINTDLDPDDCSMIIKRSNDLVDARIIDKLSMLHDLCSIQRGELIPGWLFVLQIASTHASTDPRDAVYGLLNIINRGFREDTSGRDIIVPDVRQPVRDVYIDWAVHAIREQGNLDLLAYAGTGLTGQQFVSEDVDTSDLQLPSWVPDLYHHKGHRGVNWVRRQPELEDGFLNVSYPQSKTPYYADLPINLNSHGFLKVKARRRAIITKIVRRTTSRLSRDKFLHHRECEDLVVEGRRQVVNFVLDYVRGRGGLMYPLGQMPPLQALARLALRPCFAALNPDQADPERRKTVHELCLGFLWWIMNTSFDVLCYESDPVHTSLLWACSDFGHPMSTHPPELNQHRCFEGSEHCYRRNHCTAIARILGVDFGDNFISTYRAAFFPDAAVEEVPEVGSIDDLNELCKKRSVGEVVKTRMEQWCEGTPLLLAEDGYVGSGPSNMKPRDEIYQVQYCQTPLVFRRVRRVGASHEFFEPGAKSVTLLGPCEILGVEDEYDKLRNEEYSEELLLC
ncbi:hypothetical protein VTJ04DRAFT_7290 [Mycothermus thermophilus]|uniref:uncharacterized protein n=1 Tax=Humicola insolens TaxID=85995 RepID=UPI0037443E92